ncbi:MAG: hypothetical protein ABJB76_06350 [Candidatus Nitrosocosmicus sp.]
MTYSSRSINHLVIQGYLNGKSRDQISKETGISTGKVSNVIKEWRHGIDIPNVEELRDFATEVKKSGISVGQCSQGYRMVQLMQNLGVAEDGDTADIHDYIMADDGGNNGNGKNQLEFSTFVQDMYLNCKNFGIKPAIIFSWIKDLFSCYSPPLDNSSFIDRQQQQQQQQIEKIVGVDDKKPAAAAGAFDLKMINPSTFQVETIEYELRANSKNPDDAITTTTTNNPNSTDKIIKNNIASTINPPKQKSGSQFQIESPFISQLSRHIVQKKKECIELARYNKALEKDTKILELKRKQIEFEFDLTKQEEKYVMRYID